MQVFLTGATGYIGSAVAEALRAAGHEVVGLARSDASAARLAATGVRPHGGDLHDTNSLAAAARAADAVIHTASTNDATAGAADARAVDAMLHAMDGTTKPFVYTSGVWVYGDTNGRVVDENSPLDPAPLVAWRPAVEQRALAAAKHGVRPVVIRPGIVYGRGAGIPAMFVRSARERGAARVIGTGENHWPMVHVDDLADLYVRALAQAPAGTVLNGVSGNAPRVVDIARAAAEGAGAGGKVGFWPLDEARAALGPFADALALDQQASGTRAESLLGWRPAQPDVLTELRSGSYAATPA